MNPNQNQNPNYQQPSSTPQVNQPSNNQAQTSAQYPQQAPNQNQQYQNTAQQQQYQQQTSGININFGVIALLGMHFFYFLFSAITMITLFSKDTDNNSLEKLSVMLVIMFIVTTLGFGYLLVNIFLKKYWALLVYVGAITALFTIEIKEVVVFTDIGWEYITALILTAALTGISMSLALKEKSYFNA